MTEIIVTLMVLSFSQEVRPIYELPLDQCQQIAEAQMRNNLAKRAWCESDEREWHFEGEWVEGVGV